MNFSKQEVVEGNQRVIKHLAAEMSFKSFIVDPELSTRIKPKEKFIAIRHHYFHGKKETPDLNGFWAAIKGEPEALIWFYIFYHHFKRHPERGSLDSIERTMEAIPEAKQEMDDLVFQWILGCASDSIESNE